MKFKSTQYSCSEGFSQSLSLVTFDEDVDAFDADQERGGVIWGQWGGFFLEEGSVRIWVQGSVEYVYLRKCTLGSSVRVSADRVHSIKFQEDSYTHLHKFNVPLIYKCDSGSS